LFPAPHSNPDGTRPFSYATQRARLARRQDDIDGRDEAGQPVRATAHQFRHKLGTRLINQGVPNTSSGRVTAASVCRTYSCELATEDVDTFIG
jgi:integrase